MLHFFAKRFYLWLILHKKSHALLEKISNNNNDIILLGAK